MKACSCVVLQTLIRAYNIISCIETNIKILMNLPQENVEELQMPPVITLNRKRFENY